MDSSVQTSPSSHSDYSATTTSESSGAETPKTNRTARGTASKSSFERLPAEVVLNILRCLQPSDYLSVKLVSTTISNLARKMKTNGKEELDTSTMTKKELSACHIFIERSFSGARYLRNSVLWCTRCYRLKERPKFADAQWNRMNITRFCISCGIKRRVYKSRTIMVEDEVRYPVACCFEAFPEDMVFDNEEVLTDAMRKFWLGDHRVYSCEACTLAALPHIRALRPHLFDL